MILLFGTLRKVFFLIFNAIQANSGFLVRRQISNESKNKLSGFLTFKVNKSVFNHASE